jgi:hypothetical protein
MGVKLNMNVRMKIMIASLAHCRVVEDYGVIYLGSAVFKIARLLFIAMFSVHLFACIFFRVKVASALTPDDVSAFYTSKNVPDDVSLSFRIILFISRLLVYVFLVDAFAICFPVIGPSTTICEGQGKIYRLITLVLIMWFLVAASLLLLCSHNVHNCGLW